MRSTALAGDPAVVRSLIDGASGADSSANVAVSENPARPGEPVGRYVVVGQEAAGAAVAASAASLAAWRRRSAIERGAILRQAAALLAERREDIAFLVTAEQGKTIGESRREVDRAVDTIYYHAASAYWPSGETFPDERTGDLVRSLRVPVGVVAVITPWNYPVSIPVWKIAPALVHGNTVVWKPASPVPIVSVRLAEVFRDAGVPSGVLQVLLGGGAVGSALVDDPRVAAITFTGSEGVGRRIAAAAVARNAKCQVELGGHNPAIVLADADLAVTVDGLTRAVANGAGQKCTATRRIIAEQPIRDRLVEALGARFAALRVGDGAMPETEVCPLISMAARDEVASEIGKALEDGCVTLAKTPNVPDEGAFLAPTLLGSADQSPRICREEVFGPVAVVVPADDPEHALRLAVDTRFGLSASVYTSSERFARYAAEELPVGTLNVNRPSSDTGLHVPFGGMKDSSGHAPTEQGMTARDFYTDIRAIFSRATA